MVEVLSSVAADRRAVDGAAAATSTTTGGGADSVHKRSSESGAPTVALDSAISLRRTALLQPDQYVKYEQPSPFWVYLLPWRRRSAFTQPRVVPSETMELEDSRVVSKYRVGAVSTTPDAPRRRGGPSVLQRLAGVLRRENRDNNNWDREKNDMPPQVSTKEKEIRLIKTRLHRNLDEGAEGLEQSRLVSNRLRLDTLQQLALRHFSTNISNVYHSDLSSRVGLSAEAKKYAERRNRAAAPRDLVASDISENSQESLCSLVASLPPIAVYDDELTSASTSGSVLPEVQLQDEGDRREDVDDSVPGTSHDMLVKQGSPKRNPKQLKLKIGYIADGSAIVEQVAHSASSLSAHRQESGKLRNADDVFVSSSGAVHGGNWKIEESGISFGTSSQTPRSMSPRNNTSEIRIPRKFEFLEVGNLGSGTSGSVVEALHIPSLTLVAMKILPVYDVNKLQSVARELSVLYGNLNELRELGNVQSEDAEICQEGKRRNRSISNKCPYILGLYDGAYNHSFYNKDLTFYK